MGAAFDGKLNRNSRRNDGAISEGSNLHSYDIIEKLLCNCLHASVSEWYFVHKVQSQ